MSGYSPIPISLVSGFLGAGKTTLINRLLRAGHLTDAALIVNEFGEVGIDHLLVETVQDDIIELSGGCLCCSIRGSLVDTLINVLSRGPAPPSQIVVETTGVADPLPVMQVIFGHPQLHRELAFAGLLSVVDAVLGEQVLQHEPAARAQVALADHIAISKTDLNANRSSLISSLSQLNPHASVIEANDTDSVAKALAAAQSPTVASDRMRPNREANKARDITSVFLISDAPMPLRNVQLFFDEVRNRTPGGILRMKGFVYDIDAVERPAIVHGVQDTLYPFETRESWPGEWRETRLVVIGRGIDRQVIRDRFHAISGQAVVDTPDLAALSDNPLAVPGMRF